jgi:hypothetical protein
MLIEVQGEVNERGEVEIHWPADLPPGKIRVVIESYDPDLEAVEDAKWDASFAKSQSLLSKLATEAHADYLAGNTEEFDPDTEEL